ncbi:MAG: hypothetical protein NPIRA02_12830 [Nitrospirales bacterium]|nr:MAG: hypothetical protein NPIRA02_12830 [Nitrospirales bacterium]
MVDVNGRQWEEYLRFRDFLRTHREARQVYVLEKERLAECYTNDREAYTATKETIVRKLLTEAKQAAT